MQLAILSQNDTEIHRTVICSYSPKKAANGLTHKGWEMEGMCNGKALPKGPKGLKHKGLPLPCRRPLRVQAGSEIIFVSNN